MDRDTVRDAWQTFHMIETKMRRLLPQELFKSRSKGHNHPVSIQSVLDRMLDDDLREFSRKNPSKESLEDRKRAFNLMRTHLTFHEGDELYKVAWEEEFDDMPGGDMHIPGGYKQLLDHLASRLLKDSLRLNTEVVKIRMRPASVEVSTRGGSTMAADHVIVTSSLGYLKKYHSSMFNPALPEEKIAAINRMGFGRVNKIFLEFDRPLTSPTYHSIGFAWDHTDIGPEKAEWFRNIFGLDQVFTRDTTVLGWVAGDSAEHMESLSDKEIGETCVKILRKFLNDDTIPYPKKVVVSRWCSDPYALGCYSYTTPNLKTGDHQRLLEPMCSRSGEPRILFAGEATVKEEFGCTHGARMSGIREARRLCDIYPNKLTRAKL